MDLFAVPLAYWAACIWEFVLFRPNYKEFAFACQLQMGFDQNITVIG